MLRIKEQPKEADVIPMSEMKPLQVGVVVGGVYSGTTVFRTKSDRKFEIVGIHPDGTIHSWTEKPCTTNVKLLPPGEKITLELWNE